MMGHEVSRALLYSFFVIIAFAGVSSSAIAQQSDKIIFLNHADSLVGAQIDTEQVKQFIGHVKLSQGNVVVTCQKAVQYVKSNKVELEGDVVVHDDSVSIVSNRGIYYAGTKVAEAYDHVILEDKTTRIHADYGRYGFAMKQAYFSTNVSVEDSASTLTSDELMYYRNEEKSIATMDVKIINKDSSVTILGNHFENFRKSNYSIMTESPKLIQIEKNADGKRDTLTVTSQKMESYQDSLERLIATGDVVLVREGFAAAGGSSIFYTSLDSIELRKKPIVWYIPGKHDENQVTGDSIFMKLKKRKLETVYVMGSAFAISRSDSAYAGRFNQLTGQEIVMNFAESKVRRIDVDKTATSLYYLFDGTTPNGMNKTSGDHITFFFREGKIDKLKVVGGVEGQYYPEKMIYHRETEYNLPGFNWQEQRPGSKR